MLICSEVWLIIKMEALYDMSTYWPMQEQESFKEVPELFGSILSLPPLKISTVLHFPKQIYCLAIM